MVIGGNDPPASLPGGDEDRVFVRLEFTAKDLDTDPPPARCHIRAYETASGWVLLMWTAEGLSEATRAWAKAQAGAGEMSLGEISERTVAFRCESIPEPWENLFGVFDAQYIVMEPDGTTRTRIEGNRAEIGDFLKGMELELAPQDVKEASKGEDPEKQTVLTDRQEQALGRAVGLGYFDVPRRIQLAELADRLDMSTSGLSELLRRAQARLASTYLDNQLGGIEAVLNIDEAEDSGRPKGPL